MTNPLIFDFFWKLLFFVSIFSTFYFLFAAISHNFFKFFSASKKMKAFKVSQFLLLFSFIAVAIYIAIADNELVFDCFGRFAEREGVFGITRVISAIWVLGLLLFLIRDIFQYLVIKRSLDEAIIESKQLIVGEKNISYNSVNNKMEAVVAGFLKPQIYIPQFISENESALRQTLAHECIHIQNKDSFWNFVSLVIHRLNWHNPLAHFSLRKLKVQLEMATDEQAISEFQLNVAEYARHLVSFISASKRESLLTMNVSGSFSQVQLRLLNLKNIQNGKIQSRSVYIWALIITLLTGLTQAFASIQQESPPLGIKAPMCFQVKHEIILEGWLHENKSNVVNKCE